jgi:hypothetical protein
MNPPLKQVILMFCTIQTRYPYVLYNTCSVPYVVHCTLKIILEQENASGGWFCLYHTKRASSHVHFFSFLFVHCLPPYPHLISNWYHFVSMRWTFSLLYCKTTLSKWYVSLNYSVFSDPSFWRSSNFMEEWSWGGIAFCQQQGTQSFSHVWYLGEILYSFEHLDLENILVMPLSLLPECSTTLNWFCLISAFLFVLMISYYSIIVSQLGTPVFSLKS